VAHLAVPNRKFAVKFRNEHCKGDSSFFIQSWACAVVRMNFFYCLSKTCRMDVCCHAVADAPADSVPNLGSMVHDSASYARSLRKVTILNTSQFFLGTKLCSR
jgi:hypothetical protein